MNIATSNPEVSASAAHPRMLDYKARQAGSLEDPMLMLKIQNGIVDDPFNFRKDPMTQKVIGYLPAAPFLGEAGS